MNRLIPAISLILAICLATHSLADNPTDPPHSQQNMWDVRIELVKDRYILHEPIWLDVTLTNVAADTQRTHGLGQPNHRRFYIILKDSSGKQMKYNGAHVLFVNAPGRLLLRPGQQDFGSFNLAQLFQPREANSGFSVLDDFSFIPKGEYSVQATFEDTISNELTFTVVEPSGEEKEALELIEKASSVWNLNNTDPAVEIFREVVARYPNGVFAERCFYIAEAYNMDMRRKLKQGPWTFRPIYTKMLEHYPNSGNADEWVHALTIKLEDSARRKLLNELAEAHPDTRCARYVDVLRDRMTGERAD